MRTPKTSSSFVVAEWLMIIPAAVFILAGILRLVQPSQYEPARTSWIIFNWTTTHISQMGAAVLFLGLPAMAIILGSAMLARNWHDDEVLRHDVKLALTICREHAAAGLLATGTLMAAAILVFAVVHVIAG